MRQNIKYIYIWCIPERLCKLPLFILFMFYAASPLFWNQFQYFKLLIVSASKCVVVLHSTCFLRVLYPVQGHRAYLSFMLYEL